MCGLFGYINVRKQTKVNKAIYHTLGMVNDARGGDSIGYFIDNYVYKGIDKDATSYSQLYSEELDAALDKPVNIALGHCRKTSVGSTTLAAAQPVVVADDEGNVELVMLHNGTLINYKELAKKYLGEIPDYFTDSYIMAHIVNKHGFDVLGEYKGAGAFVFVDYKKGYPAVYFFKGSSILKSADKEASEERPLFYHYNPNTGGLYYSSICKILETTTFNLPTDVFGFASNTLYLMTKNGLKTVKSYDRSAIKSYKEYSSYTNLPNTSSYSNYNYGNTYDDNTYGYGVNHYIKESIVESPGMKYLNEFMEGDAEARLDFKFITEYEDEVTLNDVATDVDGRLYDVQSNYYTHGQYHIIDGKFKTSVYCSEGYMFKSEDGVKVMLLLKTLSGGEDTKELVDKYYPYLNNYLINPILTTNEEGSTVAEVLTRGYNATTKCYDFIIKPKITFQENIIKEGKFSRICHTYSSHSKLDNAYPTSATIASVNPYPSADKTEIKDLIDAVSFLSEFIN